MSNQKRLGRGLQALLGGGFGEPQGAPHEQDAAYAPPHDEAAPAGGDTGVLLLGVDEIYDNPFQPRRDFSESEIQSLSESLKEHDMLQPILVRRMAGGFQLIAGERRLRAARQAGWTHVPCQVKEADDRLVAELAIVENLQRQDLNAIEKALSFQRYIEQHHCTQDDLAQRIKVDRATIANMMRLLELPGQIKDAVAEKKLTAGHARALLPLGDERKQIEFADKIQTEGLSVRAIEQLVRETIDAEDREPLSVVGEDGVSRPVEAPPKNAHLADLEQQLKTALGTKVEVRQSGKKKGKIVIHFGSPEEFERIRAHLTGHVDPAQQTQQG
ncbi:MAG: ParB/RepB/Spo0J family partition protein [Planctomycetales bacterium]|nr:ParB/RepB/Spo0J family partition protein [Planctomycetales bacterium]